MDKLSTKSIAYVNWPKLDPSKGLTYGIQAKDIPVWLQCREDSMQFSFMKARLHPGTSPKNAQLIIVCPLCAKISGQQLRIDGSKKTFQWESLKEPIQIPVSDVPEDAFQSVVLTVLEPLGCPTCGRYFKITENMLHKA